MHNEVHKLARRLTTRSQGPPGKLFPVSATGPLNPAFYDIQTNTSEGTPPKTTGVAFRNLNTVSNAILGGATIIKKLCGQQQQQVDILHNLEGVVHSGEMCAVLGPPGSGCSTFLRIVAGDTRGFHGIRPSKMITAFRGEAIYTAEVDHYFPYLTVGDTLYFAARARCPKNIPEGITRREYAEHLRDVTMAIFGISHTKNTRVGDDFIRGVSGGERKRVIICWDNSTRGLDSANTLEFCRTLRTQADTMGCTSCVAIYQVSQDAYDAFDKVIVLYEGRQIYFGKTTEAKAYFESIGFLCPEQQTTADFPTSMTSHYERVIRPGWEGKPPRSSDEFAKAWKVSQLRARLMEEIDDYLDRHPFGGDHYERFLQSHKINRIIEILTLYAKRNIVEKHSRYALYHPSAEALSAMVMDLPYKIVNAIILNTTLYFMSNLRREPGPFFFFLLMSFMMTLAMSMMFRLVGSVTKSVAQALVPGFVIILVVAMYTGFAITPNEMKDWLGWIRWINPIYYGLESLFLNEFVGRNFTCSTFIPTGSGYENVGANERVCNTVGSVPGQDFVSGTDYVRISFGFINSRRWRNFGVLIVFAILFMGMHLVATEYVSSERSKEKCCPPVQSTIDDSAGQTDMERQASVFHWKDACYEIKIESETRKILDHVDGWVKPGTLTALMGISGAGKTTLLDVLATRVTMGVVTGQMLVDGRPRDSSFQRKTGYVQQQDLHLATSTVREALNFSALLRQPPHYSRHEKLEYVDTVISMLGIEEYSDAVIGVPGEGLNVEQRKRLTIGVELAARPQLLLFLDEPTSGLDSQTSWSVCNLMEKLTKSGQAILCTIHQPSTMLFQRFDRLLLLAKGGKTVYFGDIGKNSKEVVGYFVRNGAAPLPSGANPAEYMLEVIGASPGAHTETDWPVVWRQSPEYQDVQEELARLCAGRSAQAQSTSKVPSSYAEFAAGMGIQLFEVTKRAFQQYWRTPAYIFSKATLSFGTTLFIGLSFLNAKNTQRGLQSQILGVFIFLTIFSQVVMQILPNFVSQRNLYEARERPSKSYSWKAFMVANISVEIAWNSLMSVFCFVCWYFPIGLYENARYTDAVDSRGIAMFLHVWVFFIFTSTFATMSISAFESAEVASGIVNLLAIMMYCFNGVLAGPKDLPGFWTFMYRVNPFTYVVEGFLGTSIANAPVTCAAEELVTFSAPSGSTCGEYMVSFLDEFGGYLVDTNTSDCQYCAVADTNTFLKTINVSFSNRWRDFGLMWVYCIFNIAVAISAYWLFRVPKTKSKKE
ncbi:ABC-2 type transporter-domain-containing protein [Ilyonectria destructans]|nr:ABC-2 type transporter-domain-containing protein [Ilyonectria destructans]